MLLAIPRGEWGLGMSKSDKYNAFVRLRINSKRDAELLAKAIRDTTIVGKPVIKFSTADAVRVLQSLYCMPPLRVDDKE